MGKTGQKPIKLEDLNEGDLLYHYQAVYSYGKFGLFNKRMSDSYRCYSYRIFDNFDSLYSSLLDKEFSDVIKLLAKKELTTWELN